MVADRIRENSGVHPTEAVLLDGDVATIRDVVSSDHDALEALFDAASDDNIYRRFFTPSHHVAHSFVECVCRDDDRHLAIVAEVGDQLVGVFDAELTAHDVADVSLFVADDFHRHGVGTILLAIAADALRRRGVVTLTADVLTSNAAMLHVFARSGFSVTMRRDESVVAVTIALTDA